MATFRSTPISAKEVKTAMKSLGIKVLRAAQHNHGVLITIVDTLENQQKTIEYFNANDMAISPALRAKVVTGGTYGYIDYGTIFKWVEL